MALRWRQEPRETGLGAISQGLRGYELRDCGEDIGSVSPVKDVPWSHTAKAWWWWALGYNSYANKQLYSTADEAKAACMAYVKANYKKEVQHGS